MKIMRLENLGYMVLSTSEVILCSKFYVLLLNKTCVYFVYLHLNFALV